MVEGQEFKVIIKKSGQIFHEGSLIAIHGQWNRYEDLDSGTLYNQIKERNK